ncbi:MAG: N-acetylmuramoyl-L-alanine amidase [Chloroflexota bacterium]
MAAREYGVPRALLLALSYNETLWEQHSGVESVSGGFGLMHLTHVDSPRRVASHAGKIGLRTMSGTWQSKTHTLDLASKLLGMPRTALEHNPLQNIRGGASLLASYARVTTGGLPADIGRWYGAVVLYSASQDTIVANQFASDVFTTLRQGVTRVTSTGERLTIHPMSVTVDMTTTRNVHLYSPQASAVECPRMLDCRFTPAAYMLNDPSDPTSYGNYDIGQRPKDGLSIRYIVIHDTEGSYDSAVGAFQNSLGYTSAHYVIRSTDGQITQMVRGKDIAWHAGNYYFNEHAIGVEHEGIAVDGPTWYSEPMYRASARLVRYLAIRYHVPLDRAHIVGHDDIPGPTPQVQSAQHWDPGPYWDWSHYMDLLGSPIGSDSARSNGDVITITPSFSDNLPDVAYCRPGGKCGPVAAQPSNFVYLHTAPDPASPLVADPALHPGGSAGTTMADDWGDKAGTGQSFYLVNSIGDWDAIFFGGQEAWFYNPSASPTAVPSTGKLVTPRSNRVSIPVYGRAYPEASAYPRSIAAEKLVPLQYVIPSGQMYVATDLVQSDFYWAPTQQHHRLIRGRTQYYQIFFGHRLAFVKRSDVETVKSTSTQNPT